jgi:starch phosphorylase
VIDLLAGGAFAHGDRTLFAPLVEDLVHRDPFLVLADFRAYCDAQARVAAAWRTPAAWVRSSILNTARAGRFSSDRSIREYAEQIWRISPVTVP